MAPRGIRNNNPGNIEYGDFARSRGATGTDGRFATFATPEDGIRALSDLLDIYAARGLDTPASIIGRYAPASENPTAAYALSLARSLGITANTQIDLSDPAVKAAVIGSIIGVEVGQSPWTAGAIQEIIGGQAPSFAAVEPLTARQMSQIAGIGQTQRPSVSQAGMFGMPQSRTAPGLGFIQGLSPEQLAAVASIAPEPPTPTMRPEPTQPGLGMALTGIGSLAQSPEARPSSRAGAQTPTPGFDSTGRELADFLSGVGSLARSPEARPSIRAGARDAAPVSPGMGLSASPGVSFGSPSVSGVPGAPTARGSVAISGVGDVPLGSIPGPDVWGPASVVSAPGVPGQDFRGVFAPAPRTAAAPMRISPSLAARSGPPVTTGARGIGGFVLSDPSDPASPLVSVGGGPSSPVSFGGGRSSTAASAPVSSGGGVSAGTASRASRSDPSEPVGGGEASTVLCTWFMRKGRLSKHIWMADTRFAQTLSQKTVSGYRAWAVPAVGVMQRGGLVGELLELLLWPITDNWAHYAAWRIGRYPRFRINGLIVHSILAPLSYIIGVLALKSRKAERTAI